MLGQQRFHVRLAALLGVTASPGSWKRSLWQHRCREQAEQRDIEAINLQQEHLSSDEAVTPPCAYCRAQVSGRAIWLIPGLDLQSNPWEPQTQVRGGPISPCHVLSFSQPHGLPVPIGSVAPVSPGEIPCLDLMVRRKRRLGEGCLGGRDVAAKLTACPVQAVPRLLKSLDFILALQIP